MNKRLKKLIVLTLLLIAPLIYINRSSYIAKYSWKSVSKNRIIDWMEFTNEYLMLDGKTIRLVDTKEKKGRIILCLHKYLIARNNNGEICFYTNKG